MKLNLLFILIVTTIGLSFNSLGNELASPKDTTTKLFDRAGALLLIDDARLLYNEGKVKDALNLFREAAAKDPNNWRAPYWISNCHYNMSNYGFALKYAKEALRIDPKEVDKDVYEMIGQAFHQIGQIDSALANYTKALAKVTPTRAKELRIAEKIEQCNFVKSQLGELKTPIRTRLQGDVNSGFNEYGALLTKGGKILYFTSRRSNTKGGKANPDDQEYFEDIYRADWNDSEQKWDSVTNDIDRINTEGFDAFTFISNDGLYALLTLNTAMTDVSKQTQSSDICEVQFTDKGKWSSPKIIKNKTINTSFYDGSATVTADGSTMYFVSDRKGDKRSTDIYMVKKNGKKWGVAEQLTDSINTIGRETTPVISADGRYLFFSSDGHAGMGGLDVFVSENLGGNKWTKPKNLGALINTVNNDTHFSYYPEFKKAFLTTYEIVGQKSSMDIYEIDMSNFILPKF